MTTVQQALDEAQYTYLQAGTLREAKTLLAATMDTSTDQLTFLGSSNNIGPGTLLSVGLEEMTVVSVSGSTATVIRGDRGSTAEAHAINDQVFINPKWTYFRLYEAMLDELDRLSTRGLYQMKDVDLRFVSSRRQYNIPLNTPEEWIADYDVRWETTDSSYMWPRVNSYEIVRQMPEPGDTTDDAGTPINKTFASGFTILLHEGGVSGRALRIWYRARFDRTAITGLNDDLTVTGLHVEAHDILAIGTALRLLPAREVARNLYENQGPTRRAEEVPPSASQRAPLGLMQLYDDRVEDEVNRLNRRWPKYKNFTTQTLNSLSMGAGYGWH